MKRMILGFAIVGAIGLSVFWKVTAIETVDPIFFKALNGNSARGEQVFHAAGCASCHSAPYATTENALTLAGGQRFASPFGTFIAPNISPDPEHGIGDWSVVDLANALQKGVSKQGTHLYPSLPYWSYARMVPQDIADLHAYMMTLPATQRINPPHEISFPFNIRRLVGGWKLLNMRDDFVITGDLTPQEERGRYIAEALAHCGECHTPRNLLGALEEKEWLKGAPGYAGAGKAPALTPEELNWSADEISAYLSTGFTPDYDSVGGHMVHVVENISKLSDDDRLAIAAYLKRLR